MAADDLARPDVVWSDEPHPRLIRTAFYSLASPPVMEPDPHGSSRVSAPCYSICSSDDPQHPDFQEHGGLEVDRLRRFLATPVPFITQVALDSIHISSTRKYGRVDLDAFTQWMWRPEQLTHRQRLLWPARSGLGTRTPLRSAIVSNETQLGLTSLAASSEHTEVLSESEWQCWSSAFEARADLACRAVTDSIMACRAVTDDVKAALLLNTKAEAAIATIQRGEKAHAKPPKMFCVALRSYAHDPPDKKMLDISGDEMFISGDERNGWRKCTRCKRVNNSTIESTKESGFVPASFVSQPMLLKDLVKFVQKEEVDTKEAVQEEELRKAHGLLLKEDEVAAAEAKLSGSACVLDSITPMAPLDDHPNDRTEGFGSGCASLPSPPCLDDGDVEEETFETENTGDLNNRNQWKSGLRKSLHIQRMSSLKVPAASKVGVIPTGWMGNLAFALQSGLTALFHHSSEAPPSNGSGGTGPAPQSAYATKRVLTVNDNVKITEHMPSEFLSIRGQFHVTEIAFSASLGVQQGQKTPSLACIDRNHSSGKSSAFYFLSPCQRFFLKSLKQDEMSALIELLPGYISHIARATMLPSFLGLYTIDLGKDKVHVVAMNNVFASPFDIDQRYDLKGSTFGRQASKKEAAKLSPVLKDLDWMKSDLRIPVGPRLQQVLGVSKRDALFLAEHNIIDYSLLVGVHHKGLLQTEGQTDMASVHSTAEGREKGAGGRRGRRASIITQTEEEEGGGGHTNLFEDDSRVFICGIVDVLQTYVSRKKMENFCCGTLCFGRDISCQPPGVYAARFIKFLESNGLSST